jgi:hypothetical protein
MSPTIDGQLVMCRINPMTENYAHEIYCQIRAVVSTLLALPALAAAKQPSLQDIPVQCVPGADQGPRRHTAGISTQSEGSHFEYREYDGLLIEFGTRGQVTGGSAPRWSAAGIAVVLATFKAKGN